jgi:hypothetical protein
MQVQVLRKVKEGRSIFNAVTSPVCNTAYANCKARHTVHWKIRYWPDGDTKTDKSRCPAKTALNRSNSFTLDNEPSLLNKLNLSGDPLGMTHTTWLSCPQSKPWKKIFTQHALEDHMVFFCMIQTWKILFTQYMLVDKRSQTWQLLVR